MEEKYPKFIVEDDFIIIGKVDYHNKLVTNKEKVKGGGWFKWSKDKSTLIFYGDSHEFGKFNPKDIIDCVEKDKVFTNKYQTHSITDKHNFAYEIGDKIIKI